MRLCHARQAVLVILCLLIASNELHADVIPGKWDKVDSQIAGTKLAVKLKAGDRVECVFWNANPDEMVVRDRQGVERRIRKTDVARVETAGRSGRRAVLIGTVAGAAPMAALGALTGRAIGESGGDALLGAAILGGVGAGIGALVGYAVGKLHKDVDTLYVAPGGAADSPTQ